MPFEGFARCVNEHCGHIDPETEELVTLYNVARPILLEKDVVKQYGTKGPGDLFGNMVLNETEYIRPVDDADSLCPDCGFPCALLPEKPITFARKYGDYAPR